MTATNPGKTNLEAWWSLEENGGDAVDSHGSNDLTETSGTIPAVTGKVNNGRDIEWDDSEYFSIASNAALSFGDEGFTIGFWVKIESYATDRYRYILGKSDGTNNKREYSIANITNTRKVGFSVSADGTNSTWVQTADAIANSSTWGFILAWHDPSANKIYISLNNGTPAEASHSGGVKASDSQFRIGNIQSGAAAGGYMDGQLDEVFIYRRVLTADEREWLYNSGNGRAYSELEDATKKKNQVIWW